MIDYDNLDRLHAAATEGPWSVAIGGLKGARIVARVDGVIEERAIYTFTDDAMETATFHNTYPAIREHVKDMEYELGQLREVMERLIKERKELKADRARLDWLIDSSSRGITDYLSDTLWDYATDGTWSIGDEDAENPLKLIRAAIDAGMGQEKQA